MTDLSANDCRAIVNELSKWPEPRLDMLPSQYHSMSAILALRMAFESMAEERS